MTMNALEYSLLKSLPIKTKRHWFTSFSVFCSFIRASPWCSSAVWKLNPFSHGKIKTIMWKHEFPLGWNYVFWIHHCYRFGYNETINFDIIKNGILFKILSWLFSPVKVKVGWVLKLFFIPFKVQLNSDSFELNTT